MPTKSRPSAKGPPPHAQKWLAEHRRGLHQGRIATPERYQSIWDTSCIPDRFTPATPEMTAEAEARLGIVIPAVLREQLLIQNGGYLLDCHQYPFAEAAKHWTNAAVDGIYPVQSWKRARNDNWFESVNDVEGLDLLIIIAAHAESQLCLDYRQSGSRGLPAVTFIDVCKEPTEVKILADTVDEFIGGFIALRPTKDST
jgi:hypothetical protein